MTVSRPRVSVIVPVYNEEKSIGTCVEALLEQTYDDYEILVVDNGSTDNTRNIIEDYPVKLLIEDGIQSSYAARNKGIREAKGDVIALIDADCTPSPDWIEHGIQTMTAQSADLVGGNVRFEYSPKPTAAEILDSITNMQMRRSVEERGVAKTANLFVRSEVFDDIGPFPSDLISGGDVYWTGKATEAGYRLVFSDKATVSHPARQFRSLLKKQHRVGRGQIQFRSEQGWTVAKRLRLVGWLVIGFAPKPPNILRDDLQRKDIDVTLSEFIMILFVAWCCRIAENSGRIQYLIEDFTEQ